MTLKADLELENELLRKLVSSGTHIENCTFHGTGGPPPEVAEAVKEIAIACQMAAKALGQAGSGVAIQIGSIPPEEPNE